MARLSVIGAPGGSVAVWLSAAALAGQGEFDPSRVFLSTIDTSGTNGDQQVVADDFSPGMNAELTTLCWFGVLWPADAGNPPADSFVVRYRADEDGQPGGELASFSQSAGTLMNLAATPTGSVFGKLPILEYTADHAAVPVEAGACYWLEVANDVGGDGPADAPSRWLWQMSVLSSHAPFYQGNGRLAADGFAEGAVVDGFSADDLVGGGDLAFCFEVPLADPACGLGTLYDTGPETAVFVPFLDITDIFFLGWSSGQLCSPDCANDEFPQRRTAQAFMLPDPGDGTWLRVRQIFVDGYSPLAGELNESLEFEIFTRDDLARPEPEDSLITGAVPFASTETGLPHPQFAGLGTGIGAPAALHALHADFSLPPGDYWLTVWASNDDPEQSSNFAWYTNPPIGLNVFCAAVDCLPSDCSSGPGIGCDSDNCDPQQAVMWRACHWPPQPDGFGFGSYSVPSSMLDVNPNYDPDPDPDDLFNAAFMIRGTPGGTCGNGAVEPGETCDPPGAGCTSICQVVEGYCPWDCADGDGAVGLEDFLAILGTWGQTGVPCDIDGDGVGITDFLKVLGAWGPCP